MSKSLPPKINLREGKREEGGRNGRGGDGGGGRETALQRGPKGKESPFQWNKNCAISTRSARRLWKCPRVQGTRVHFLPLLSPLRRSLQIRERSVQAFGNLMCTEMRESQSWVEPSCLAHRRTRPTFFPGCDLSAWTVPTDVCARSRCYWIGASSSCFFIFYFFLRREEMFFFRGGCVIRGMKRTADWCAAFPLF